MATFKFGRYIDIHWNGYDIQGPADTVFSIPDQLYEEFDADIAPVEPTLQWIDTNEFQTLQNSVPNYTIAATSPIAIGSSTATSGAVTKTWSLDASYATSTHLHSGVYQPAGTYVNAIIGSSPASVATASGTATVSISSGTNPNGYLLTADGSGGVIFTPASTSGLTSVVGISPISSIITGGTVSVSLNANYQTAGTYVSSVIGSAPVSASGTTAITVSIDQTALSVSNADTATTLRTYVKNASGSTITKGQAVYITGADGTNALIGLASATSDAASSKTLGIAASTMTNNEFGYVIENGQLSNIDTSATTAGAAIWLGNTPGSLVFGAPPAEPSHFVYLGVVTKANVSTGEILVKVQNGYELNELHDVFTTGVSTSLPLVYNATSDGWIAQALSSVGIADNAVIEAKINAAAVTSSKIADNAVVSTKIIDGAITSAKIGAGAINSTHIGANAVVAGDIAAGAVNSTALADNAVVAAKINAGAVDTSKISSGAAANGTVLTANGSGAVSFTTISSTGNIVVEALTGTGTWVRPSGVNFIDITIVGAGGGGGAGGLGLGVSKYGKGAGGAGGGPGRFLSVLNIYVGDATSYSYTAGSGGIGGANTTYAAISTVTKTAQTITGTNGGVGGTTTFGSIISVAGGSAGSGGGFSTGAGDPTYPDGASKVEYNYGSTGDATNRGGPSFSKGASVSGASNAAISTISGGQAQWYNNGIPDTTNYSYPGWFGVIPLKINGFVASAGGSPTISGNLLTTEYKTAIGGNSLTTNSNGPFGGAGGGRGWNDNGTLASTKAGESAYFASGNGGGGLGAHILNSARTYTLAAGNGSSATQYAGGGGGGGGGLGISFDSTAIGTANDLTVSNGSGGNGASAVMYIRYTK